MRKIICKQLTDVQNVVVLKYVKHGKVKNKQRYKCKECGYHFTVFKIGKKIERELGVRAIQLYLEGMGFRAIERILGVSHVSVMNWVEKLGKIIEQMRKNYPTEFKVVEMDELCSYIKEKEQNPDLVRL